MFGDFVLLLIGYCFVCVWFASCKFVVVDYLVVVLFVCVLLIHRFCCELPLMMGLSVILVSWLLFTIYDVGF